MRGKTIPLVLLFTLIGLSFAWSRMQIVRMSYEIHKLRGSEKAIESENEKLRIRLARLKSPKRLEKIAEERFQLKKPGPQQVWVIVHK
jgi:cell division protein FtsL